MAGSGGAGAAPREHRLQPGDTLQGLALRYGVTMEQIQRANRLYSSDSIFLRATLLIPGQRHSPGDTGGDSPGDTGGDSPGDIPGDIPGDSPGDSPGPGPGRSRRDLSASDFLRRLDAEIGRCKEAAALRLQGPGSSPGPARGGPASPRVSPTVPASPRGARLGPRPLTRTPRAAALRDSEDEIFTL
ncbi:lysM and putative peptidoglycan-binding domain-containing protein 1 [Melozone crissalis]|uniref:lysM and putative peptidoglycan-binding domain-containing protein 1 n=1 Tax=Melozone crissalis TaxID=40204 RepID=UPI0023DB8345|nr:lysM and putative peptidoglycan-binding domain-containing protein 1 [Melozone crissalis]